MGLWQVYCISKATLKIANKVSTLNNDHKMSLDLHSSVVPCGDGERTERGGTLQSPPGDSLDYRLLGQWRWRRTYIDWGSKAEQNCFRTTIGMHPFMIVETGREKQSLMLTFYVSGSGTRSVLHQSRCECFEYIFSFNWFAFIFRRIQYAHVWK